MERDVKVTFSTEDKNFGAGLTGMESRVAGMYANFAKFAKQYADNSVNAFQKVDEQIRNQERLYKGQYERTKAKASEQFITGSITEDQYRGKVQGATSAYQDQRTMIDLIKELVENDKNKNREFIAEEKKKIQEQKISDREKKLEDRSDKVKERDEDKHGDRRDARIVDIVSLMRNAVGSQNQYSAVAQAIPGITSLFTGNPVINAVAGLIDAGLQKGIEQGQILQRSSADMSQITGRALLNYTGEGGLSNGALSELSKINKRIKDTDDSVKLQRLDDVNKKISQNNGILYGGYGGVTEDNETKKYLSGQRLAIYNKDIELKAIFEAQKNKDAQETGKFFNKMSSLGFDSATSNSLAVKMSRASGVAENTIGGEMTDKDFRNQAVSAARLMKGVGIDEGTIMSLTRQGRMPGTMNATDATQSMFGVLNKATGMKESNLSLLPEYLQMLVEIDQKQLDHLGRIDEQANESKIASVAKMLGMKEGTDNPELVKHVMSKMDSLFGETSNKQMKALQYTEFAQMGVKDPFEIMKILQGNGTYNPEMYSKYIKKHGEDISGIAGGNEGLAAYYLGGGQGMQQENERMLELSKTYQYVAPSSTDAGLNIPQKASVNYGTTPVDQSLAEFTSWWQTNGSKMITDLKWIFDYIKDDAKETEATLRRTKLAKDAERAKK